MSAERASWQVKDAAVLNELIDLMNLSAEEQALLGNLEEMARAVAPRMTTAFYKRLSGHTYTAEYLQGADMARQHMKVGEWFTALFSGRYDADYAQRRLIIGQVHVRIGLPVRYPLAMLDIVMPFGEAIARQSAEPAKALAAFRKVLALDVAIFNQAYEDNQLKHLADLVGGERLARRLLSDEG